MVMMTVVMVVTVMMVMVHGLGIHAAGRGVQNILRQPPRHRAVLKGARFLKNRLQEHDERLQRRHAARHLRRPRRRHGGTGGRHDGRRGRDGIGDIRKRGLMGCFKTFSATGRAALTLTPIGPPSTAPAAAATFRPASTSFKVFDMAMLSYLVAVWS
jgi:hypothetical protein